MALRSPLVGRAAELDVIARAMAAGERLFAITGPPGVGKTRFAEHVAHAAGDVLVCNLAHCRSLRDAAGVVGGALGLPVRRRRNDVVGAALAARGELLLVLDNAERIAGHAAAVLRWLDRAPAARALVVARTRPPLDGARCIALPPLDRDDAIALYLDRAGRAGCPGLGDGFDRELVARVVDRLDRIPLAIELAAARCELLPPAKLLERLADDFGVLRGVPDAIACSWELLAPRERTALTRLTVFQGAFSLEAAEAVLALDSVLDLLIALRNASLLEVDGGKFRLLGSVRDFARRHLVGRAAVVRRHDEHVLAEAERWAEAVDGPEEVDALHRLGALADPLHAILRGGEPRAARALHTFAAVRMPGLAELEIVDQGLRGARGGLRTELQVRRASVLRLLGRLDEARATLDAAAPRPHERRLRALALLEGGRLHVRCDEPDDAAGAFARASALFESVGDLAGQSRAEAGRSRAAELRSRFDDAVRFAERALALARRCGSALLQVHSLNAAALALEAAGRFDDALALLAEASALARAAGDLSFEGVLDGNRGCVLLRLGRLDEAEQHLRRSAALNGTHGARRREADSLVHLAIVLHERGDLARARDLYRQAFAIFRECGERKLSAELLPFRAACAAELGLLAEARADLAVARRELERLADPESLAVADTLESIGVTDTGVAAARLGRAEALLRDPAAGRVANLIVALRIVRRVLAGAPAEGLEVGPDASWFRAGDREPVDLSRHATLRRVLVALLEHRLRAPGEGLTQHDLFAIAWPNERAQSASAAGRVYTAVSSLRRLGLDGALVRRDQGYLLDAAVPVRSSATPRRGSVA